MMWRLMRALNPKIMQINSSRSFFKRRVLILTTKGRKSGLPRKTPLQYELENNAVYVASARGCQADWVRNILANPNIEIELDNIHFHALAQVITDSTKICEFLEMRLKRHPLMMGAMMFFHGLPPRPNRDQLYEFSADLAVVKINPIDVEISDKLIQLQ
ncbi:nitroreductase family deazaflavin-dependent oxidoreductase [Chloroflexota bacterium]